MCLPLFPVRSLSLFLCVRLWACVRIWVYNKIQMDRQETGSAHLIWFHSLLKHIRLVRSLSVQDSQSASVLLCLLWNLCYSLLCMHIHIIVCERACVCVVFKWDLHHVFITRLLFRLFGHERIETASVDTSRWWRVSEWEWQKKRKTERENHAPQHYTLISRKQIRLVWWWKSNKLVLIFICLKEHTFIYT